jgi:hypothetical protein
MSSFPVITTIDDFDFASSFATFSGSTLMEVVSTLFVSVLSPANFAISE